MALPRVSAWDSGYLRASRQHKEHTSVDFSAPSPRLMSSPRTPTPKQCKQNSGQAIYSH